MNIVWNYVVVGVLCLAAATLVAIGEPATAELKFAEAATAAAAIAPTAAAPATVATSAD